MGVVPLSALIVSASYSIAGLIGPGGDEQGRYARRHHRGRCPAGGSQRAPSRSHENMTSGRPSARNTIERDPVAATSAPLRGLVKDRIRVEHIRPRGRSIPGWNSSSSNTVSLPASLTFSSIRSALSCDPAATWATMSRAVQPAHAMGRVGATSSRVDISAPPSTCDMILLSPCRRWTRLNVRRRAADTFLWATFGNSAHRRRIRVRLSHA